MERDGEGEEGRDVVEDNMGEVGWGWVGCVMIIEDYALLGD